MTQYEQGQSQSQRIENSDYFQVNVSIFGK